MKVKPILSVRSSWWWAMAEPEAGKGGFDHGPLIQSLGKMGNVGRGLDSGTVTMGDFVRAKLEHAGLQQGSDAWVGQAVLMCVHGA